MARLPKDPSEAVDLLDVEEGANVIAVAPDTGYVEALTEIVGTKGSILVTDPPPDTNTRKKAVKVVDALPEDASADPVLVWMGLVQTRELRDYTGRVAPGGALWVVLPKGTKEFRAPVTEGDVKRALLVAGWKETKLVALSTDTYAVRFHRRR